MASKKSDGGFWETIRTVVYAVLIALVVRTLFYEPFNIPSGSMMPTLLEGDYLFVSKFSYGYSHHTLTFGVPLFDGRILGGEPEQGDVVVFRLPSNPSTDYIKRIVGMPGDTLQVTDGRLFINGEAVEREAVEPFVVRDRFGNVRRIAQYVETLPNGRQHRILEMSDQGFLDNTDEYTVPEGHYFVMGDNRDSSQDSRVLSQVGYIPVENLVGRAEFLWFSLDDARFWEIWKWPTELRFERMFDGVE
ncbi:MAG: signal peptidase I [Alphaproteobacteria bacterium]|jgi:signal peptidase I|nr:signal peptidase I [Alphaproteobacteria bacterium]